jgi:UDP-N-acetylglucosamine 2-epimerase (non-hydrolysing)
MVIIGTRPEAIKMAPVVKAIAEFPTMLQPIVCVTGQHREMLDQVLDIFQITPDYDLNVMQPNQTLSTLTANLITGLDKVMLEAKPDWVLVQGDTTSAMAAGLVAFYQNVKIGHIEAGLRTHDRKQPFPEEVNRRITDLMSDLYFTPTQETRANLLREGVPETSILVTGNTVIDALLMTAHNVREEPLHEVEVALDGKRMILVTSHRRENFGEPFQNVCRALKALAERYTNDAVLVFPVHYNPNVREPARNILGGVPNIVLTDPVNYKTMVKLMARSHLVLTDSGGIQEEAPSLHKPLVILRDVTERQEVVTAGAGLLVGCDESAIVREVTRLMEDVAHYKAMSTVPNPYGDGTSSLQIIRAILIEEGLLSQHGWAGIEETPAEPVAAEPQLVYQI